MLRVCSFGVVVPSGAEWYGLARVRIVSTPEICFAERPVGRIVTQGEETADLGPWGHSTPASHRYRSAGLTAVDPVDYIPQCIPITGLQCTEFAAHAVQFRVDTPGCLIGLELGELSLRARGPLMDPHSTSRLRG
jgi:hypothetical protein